MVATNYLAEVNRAELNSKTADASMQARSGDAGRRNGEGFVPPGAGGSFRTLQESMLSTLQQEGTKALALGLLSKGMAMPGTKLPTDLKAATKSPGTGEHEPPVPISEQKNPDGRAFATLANADEPAQRAPEKGENKGVTGLPNLVLFDSASKSASSPKQETTIHNPNYSLTQDGKDYMPNGVAENRRVFA